MRKFFSHRGRRLAALALCLLTLTGLLAVSAAAMGSTPVQVTAEVRPSVAILVDGVERTFYDASGKEVHAIYYNGTHYLPVRAIGELMGKNVNWDGSTRTITLSSPRTADATSGKPEAGAADASVTAQLRPDITIVVDGTTRTFTDAKGNAVYPLLRDGTNYLPVRAIGELMGKSVAWDSKSRTITLTGDDPLVTDADTFGPSDSKPTTPSDGKLTGEEAAKAAALAHAGLKAADVTFVKCKLDWEDGVQVYDVEFFTQDGREYDYEINAATGAVVSVDYDAENYVPTGTSGENIGAEKARSIALAKVPGAESTHVRKLELDYDDGRLVYEVEIFYNGMEYEGEIDAYSGEIVQWEADRD